MEQTGNINNRTWADFYVGWEAFKLKDSLDNRTWVDVYVDEDTSWKGRHKHRTWADGYVVIDTYK